MPGGGQYEPMDSRKATGADAQPGTSWRAKEDAAEGRGEYEPRDSRNVTGQPASEDERWRKGDTAPPQADGQPAEGARDVAEDEVRDEG